MSVWSKIGSGPLIQHTWCNDNKGFFHRVISSYKNGIKPRGDSHRTERNLYLGEECSHKQSKPELLCVGETGLGDRLGELVSMLCVIW